MKTSSLAAALYLLTPVVSTQDIVNNLRSASTAAANAVSVRSEYLPERRLGGGSVKDCCSAFPVAGSDCVCLSKNGNLKQRWCNDNDGSYTHENFMYKVIIYLLMLFKFCAHILCSHSIVAPLSAFSTTPILHYAEEERSDFKS